MFITLNSYQNPGNQCKFCTGNSSRCDSGESGCDNMFTYCLEEGIGSTRCSNSNITTQTNTDSVPLNFNDLSILGIPNPFRLYRPESLLKVR